MRKHSRAWLPCRSLAVPADLLAEPQLRAASIRPSHHEQRLVSANALPIDPRVMFVFACFCLLLVCLGGGEGVGLGLVSFFLSDDIHY